MHVLSIHSSSPYVHIAEYDDATVKRVVSLSRYVSVY